MTASNKGYDDLMISIICWLNTGSDSIQIVLALVLLYIMRKAPIFLKRPPLLIIIACVTDLLTMLCMIFGIYPSLFGSVLLYSLAGMSTFTDILVYWIIAYMYWVTSRSLAKKVQDKDLTSSFIKS